MTSAHQQDTSPAPELSPGDVEGRSESRSVTVLRAIREPLSRVPGRRTTKVTASSHEKPTGLSPQEGRALVRRVRFQMLLALAVANLIGSILVVVMIFWVLPGSPEDEFTTGLLITNLVIGVVFLLVVIPVSIVLGEAWLRSGRVWLEEGRAPTGDEVMAVLRAPFRTFTVQVTAWLLAATLFGIGNGIVQVELLSRVVFTVALGGFTTSATIYLLSERITRPAAAVALAATVVSEPRLPGVVSRSILAWVLGTGVPLAGLGITGLFALVERDATATELAVTMVVLSVVGLFVGWWVTILGARAMADPVASLGEGIDRLSQGHFDTRVEVYDGSVLGRLQAGFNDMAKGLEERELLRDLYGRQVGTEVAATSLERGFEAGGELCEVAVIFVDVVGSTTFAQDRPPDEVVEMLNRFFAVVVEEVHAHGGWINKFQGDATLAVFGAPAAIDDVADKALATARCLAERLPEEVDLPAGVGVAMGEVVAGYIGHEERFEFTVIGDPVNEAARLTELAKGYEPKVLASWATVEAAGQEAAQWTKAGTVELRGRTTPTALAVPRLSG